MVFIVVSFFILYGQFMVWNTLRYEQGKVATRRLVRNPDNKAMAQQCNSWSSDQERSKVRSHGIPHLCNSSTENTQPYLRQYGIHGRFHERNMKVFRVTSAFFRYNCLLLGRSRNPWPLSNQDSRVHIHSSRLNSNYRCSRSC
jgi:hypothetical protein